MNNVTYELKDQQTETPSVSRIKNNKRKTCLLIILFSIFIIAIISGIFIFSKTNKQWYLSEQIYTYYNDGVKNVMITDYREDRQILSTTYEQSGDVYTVYYKYDSTGKLIHIDSENDSQSIDLHYVKQQGNYIAEYTEESNKIIITYDNNNKIVSKITNPDNPDTQYYSSVYYDKDGNIKNSKTYISESEYMYNKDKNVSEHRYTLLTNSKDTQEQFVCKYQYKNHRLFSTETYNEKNELTEYCTLQKAELNTYYYTKYDKNENILGYLTVTYDDYNHVISNIEYDSDYSILTTTENHWIEKSKAY